MDATAQHLKFWLELQDSLMHKSNSTTWFYPTYPLTPHASYPDQISHAIDALKYVLNDLGRKPEEVILISDSAGGSLCIAILSHLMRPSSNLPGLTTQNPLRAMVLMSPWVSFDTSWGSMKSNYGKDIESREILTKWSQDYLGHKVSNNFSEAILAPWEWWKYAPVERTLVVAGADEVPIDHISIWVDKFKVCGQMGFVESILNMSECK